MISLQQKDRENIWHPFTPLLGAEDPIIITSGKGVYLHTADGRKIIDAVSSWWVNLHGHSNPVLAKALATQALVLEHVIFAGFTHQPAIDLSENLLSILPANQTKIFFSDNGSTAVEVGIKMALQYWHNKGIPKKKIIALQGAYHGDTFGAMSVGDRGIFTEPFSPFLFDVEFIDFPFSENEPHTLSQFESIVNTNEVAAFIFEPLIQAAGGMRMYSPAVLDKLIMQAHHHNVLCIADEVFTGFGRTGKHFACHHLMQMPDIMALSKGLTGGTMPLGVTTCSAEITEAFQSENFLKTFFHGHSYTANPLACSVANASYALLMSSSCQQSIARINAQHESFKNEIKQHQALMDVRVLGTIIAFELKTNSNTSYTNEVRKRIYLFFLDKNILIRPLGNVFYILPPYVCTDEELAVIYTAIKEFLSGIIQMD